ncbi:mucoidy inhibitor MuiA family protein [Algicella marina]|nr:mucoidy inhibitor MuiA family protein [Algicella marina]
MRFALPTAALLLSTSAAIADDITAASTIAAATVYPGGATVTRTVPVTAGAGSHTITVSDLPLDFDADSLRVTGEDSLTILSVNHRIDRLPPREENRSPEHQAAEAAVEAVQQDLRDIDEAIAAQMTRIAVANKRVEFIDALIEREAQDMVDDADSAGAGLETWVSAIDTLATATETALDAKRLAEQEIARLRREREDVEKDLEKAEQALAALDLPPPPRSVATIEIAAQTPLDTELAIVYRTGQAGWSPVYDMRLDRGSAPEVKVTRHAQVTQWTGEDWDDIRLTLSTARPTGAIMAPEIHEQIARIFPVPSPKRAATLGFSDSAAVMENRMESDALAPSEPVMMEAEAPVPGFTQLTQGQTVVYQLNEPVDIAGDQTMRQVRIDQQSFPVDLKALTTPQFDTTAFLSADLTNDFGGPILPGQASMFRDGTFMGTAFIPFTPAGDIAKLPFGALDEILVSYRTLEREDGDFGLIGTTNRRIERFKITARSLMDAPVTLVVTDRAPVSEQEDLEIKTVATPRPKPVDEEGKRGVVTWELALQPGEEQVIDFGYDLTWPGDQALEIFPRPF